MENRKIYRVIIDEDIVMTGKSKADVKRTLFMIPEEYLRPKITEISAEQATSLLPSFKDKGG